ncbi:hypothetical protein [Paenibacillus jilunlii]|uniref:hypothetical protein n=1 Tax=Paenibacillus jilunlii TaxID=682956 RepID=UPI0013CFADEE|nr:hypothetical protein [Paenibacillus jilunlii]
MMRTVSDWANGMAAAYGSQDRLLSVGEAVYGFDDNSYLNRQGEDAFVYGVHGKLLVATVGSETIRYTYEGLAEELQGGSDRDHPRNMLAPLLPTAVIAPSGEATAYLYDENGLLVGLEQGDRRYSMITDAVGTPQLVVGLDGAIVKQLQYDGFGVKLLDTNPDFSVAIGFGSGLEDEGNGLVRLGQNWPLDGAGPVVVPGRPGQPGTTTIRCYEIPEACSASGPALMQQQGAASKCASPPKECPFATTGLGAEAGVELNQFQDI